MLANLLAPSQRMPIAERSRADGARIQAGAMPAIACDSLQAETPACPALQQQGTSCPYPSTLPENFKIPHAFQTAFKLS